MNSFLQGKKVLSVPPLRPMTAPTQAVVPTTSTKAHHTAVPHVVSPTVEVVKEGDKVVRLVVVCSCGERVEIECLYPGAG